MKVELPMSDLPEALIMEMARTAGPEPLVWFCRGDNGVQCSSLAELSLNQAYFARHTLPALKQSLPGIDVV